MDLERTIAQTIAQELDIRPKQVARTADLLDDGNTVPFVARYRKEVTGELDETQIRAIQERIAYLRTLEERKKTVLKSIAEQKKLTPALQEAIRSATTRQEVEDLYLPYRPKRRTRATVARERGLEPLAELILGQPRCKQSIEKLAAPFVSEQVPSIEEAYEGARDIVIETIVEDADLRKAIRSRTLREAELACTQGKPEADPQKKYRTYYAHRERLAIIPAHRLLAINRGQKEGALSVKLDMSFDRIAPTLERHVPANPRSCLAEELAQARVEAYKRRIAPAIERELRAQRTDQAELEAIAIFGSNLRSLLLQPPIQGHIVMGIDPGYRTGCKVAIVSATAQFLEGQTIYAHAPQNHWQESKEILKRLIRRHGVDLIAIGNGTASRESEALVAELIQELPPDHSVSYVMVSEAGASVYSASELAREELPGLDVSMRGAVSIARRLQDPLAELVKIDPQSIGVGLYQHDVEEKRLTQALDAVVESAVNYVGVDLDTASPALLRYVAGLTQRTANNIVAYRREHGAFRSREQLRQVKGLGDKTFEQAAGFLRVRDGQEPLDNTSIHPESYSVVHKLFQYLGISPQDPTLADRLTAARKKLDATAAKLDVGRPTLSDILDALLSPGRDPREDLPPPILRQDILKMEDLAEGMVLQGTVRNVVPFGAFVDIGVKQDGLVHVSQLADRYVKDPLEIVSPGDVVQVRVLNVDHDRGRIGLSMKDA